MKDIEFRILDILSREIGNPMSINKLTEEIRNVYGTAYYSNIHYELQQMFKNRILKHEKLGRLSFIDLNFENYLLIDLLAEMELIKKHKFLKEFPSFQLAIHELSSHIKNFYLIKSIALIEPERNAKLNRMELLVLLKPPKQQGEEKGELTAMKALTNLIQSASNIRTDFLFLRDDKFIELLKSEGSNTAKEFLSNKIVMFYPQTFWTDIKEALEKGMRIKIEKETSLSKISEQDLIFNLARFGYSEFGTTITQGKSIGIEYIIITILLKDNIRRVEAIPIILAKNEGKVNYNLLVFLAMKYNILPQLFDVLRVLDAIKPMQEVKRAVDEIKKESIENIHSGQHILDLEMKDIEKKMKLYHVLK